MKDNILSQDATSDKETVRDIKETLSCAVLDYEHELQNHKHHQNGDKIVNHQMDKLVQLVVNVVNVHKYYLNQILLD